MPFDWLEAFQHRQAKPDHYAEKTLAAYRLGMKAGGSIRGVRIEAGSPACPAALDLPPEAVYTPEDAPRLPLPGCSLGRACRCLYRPVMAYQPSGGDLPAEEEPGE